jgi:hypothetical protein
LSEANLAVQSKTKNDVNLNQKVPPTDTSSEPSADLNRHSNPANLAFQEHFSHIFTQLTALHEKLMEEEKYEEAGKVLEMSLRVGKWLGEG